MCIVAKISPAVNQASPSFRSSDSQTGSGLGIDRLCDLLFLWLKLHFCSRILEVFHRKIKQEGSRHSICFPEGTPWSISQYYRSVLARLLRLAEPLLSIIVTSATVPVPAESPHMAHATLGSNVCHWFWVFQLISFGSHCKVQSSRMSSHRIVEGYCPFPSAPSLFLIVIVKVSLLDLSSVGKQVKQVKSNLKYPISRVFHSPLYIKPLEISYFWFLLCGHHMQTQTYTHKQNQSN